MKYLDTVKLVKDKEKYKKENVFAGEIGYIDCPEIRENTFYVCFDNTSGKNWYKWCEIDIEDLELVKSDDVSDEILLNDLPKQNPKWWCKVEDGYILNLLGEKKNKFHTIIIHKFKFRASALFLF